MGKSLNKWATAKAMPSKSDVTAPVSGSRMALEEEVRRIQESTRQLAQGGEYRELPLDAIDYNPSNDVYTESDTPETISQLARSIQRSGGVLHNLVVVRRRDPLPGQQPYLLLSGERRLRALKQLREETGEERWNTVHCQVKENLDPLDEVILLDAANLESRGAAGEEKAVRKAVVRYVENIRARYNTTEEVAVRVAQAMTRDAMDERTLKTNLKIERDLAEPIRKALDDGNIPKRDAGRLVSLTEEEQEKAGKIINAMTAAGAAKDIGQFAKMLLNVVSEQNVNTRRTLMDDTITEFEAWTQFVIERNKPKEPARAVTARTIRDKYIARCEAMDHHIQALSKKRTVEDIRRYDKAAQESEQNIRARLLLIREQLDDLLRRLEPEKPQDTAEPEE